MSLNSQISKSTVQFGFEAKAIAIKSFYQATESKSHQKNTLMTRNHLMRMIILGRLKSKTASYILTSSKTPSQCNILQAYLLDSANQALIKNSQFPLIFFPPRTLSPPQTPTILTSRSTEKHLLQEVSQKSLSVGSGPILNIFVIVLKIILFNKNGENKKK